MPAGGSGENLLPCLSTSGAAHIPRLAASFFIFSVVFKTFTFHVSQTHVLLSYWSASLLSGTTRRSASSFQFRTPHGISKAHYSTCNVTALGSRLGSRPPWYIIHSQHLASPCNSQWGGFVPYCVSGSVWEDTFGSYNSGYR